MDNKPVRRLVSPSLVSIPPVETLVSDALSIISKELVKFKTKVNTGKSLDLAEGRLLTNYIKALCDLAKEDRERSKSADFSNLSNEEIIELLSGRPTETKSEPSND